MKKSFKTIISKAIQDTWKGYSVVKILPGQEDGKYRAEVKKPNGNVKPEVSIKIIKAKNGCLVANIINYAEDDDFVKVNLSDAKIVDSNDSEYKEVIDREEIEKLRAEKRANFTARLNKEVKFSKRKSNPLLEKKKINLYGRAENIEKLSWLDIPEPLSIPFYDSSDAAMSNNPCGMQIIGLDSNGKSIKRSITDSQFSDAFHILQYGKEHPVLHVTDGFLAESYTTACEIAEAVQDAFVACSAGINVQDGAYKKLKEDFPKLNLIFALDKKKAQDNFKVHNLEYSVKVNNFPYIQLNVDDRRLIHMTDFNDYALKYGKKEVKKEILLQLAEYATVLPECLGYAADQGFDVVNPRTSNFEIISKISEYKNTFSESAWQEFRKIHCLDEEHDMFEDRVENILINESKRATHNIPKGLGLFYEKGEGFVLNFTKNDRYFYTKDGGIEYTAKIKPLGNNRYVKSNLMIEKQNAEVLTEESWSDEDFETYLVAWEKMFNSNEATARMVLGFLVQSMYVSFSKCAPHMWIRGATGSGKSFLLEGVFINLLSGLAHIMQDSTKAGVEQVLCHKGVVNCPLLMIDEAGRDTEHKKRLINNLIMTARETFMGGLTPAYRGSKDQEAKIYYRAFSSVLASTTDGLEDAQDVGRFLLLDVNDIKLKGKDFEEIEQVFSGLSNKFVKAIFLNAFNHNKLFSMIHEKFTSNYKVNPKIMGHKIATLSSCMAGYAGLLKLAYGMEDEKCVDMVFIKTKDFVEKQIEEHVDRVENTVSFIDYLKRTYFINGDLKGRLENLCEESVDSDMFKHYGVKLVKGRGSSLGYYNLMINNSKYKLDSLLTNPRVILGKPIYDSRDKLIELYKSGNSDIKKYKAKDEHGKSIYVYTIQKFCKILED